MVVPRPKFQRALVALGLWALAGGGVKRAQAETGPGLQRVAVVRVEVEGNVPDAVRDLFARRVVEGLTAVKLEVLAASHVSEKLHTGSAGLASCKDGKCYPDVARALDVSYLVTCRVVESSKTYGVWLEMINGRTGASVASSRERCETCGFEEAGEKVGLAASSLRARLEALAREPARIVIRSTPPGAQVVIDGKPMGPAPLDIELGAGRHRAALKYEGHMDMERTFTVVSGVDETMDIALNRIPSAFPYRAVGWAGVAVGALVMAGGIWALQHDGKEVSCSAEKDPNGHCPKIWSTKAGGAAMLGLGAAAASLGGVFIYVGRDTPSSQPSSPRDESDSASLSSVHLGYSGRF